MAGKYSFTLWSLTLNDSWEFGCLSSKTPKGRIFSTMNGPLHLDFSFPEKNLSIDIPTEKDLFKWFLSCILFVDSCILIHFIPQFTQFLHVHKPLSSCCIHVHIQGFQCPISLMFQLHWQMACFPIYKLVRTHANMSFECCPVGP